MWYIIVGVTAICIVVIVVVLKYKKRSDLILDSSGTYPDTWSRSELRKSGNEPQELVVQMEMFPAEELPAESRLAEITDSKVLAHVNNLVPGLAQAGNAVNNVVNNAAQANGEVLYRAIIPAGAKLADSRAMQGAKRAIFHGADGIKGQANLVAVETQKGGAVVANTAAAAMGGASMVVGQYYMTQINAELGAISDNISKVSDFQDNEYRSRVFSLIAHVKKIADFQVEILENEELRLSKISQLDSLEEECTKLLGQADLAIAGFAKKTELDYASYEKNLIEAQNWFLYQKSLLDVLYKISDLRYTLHLGAVSREHCTALLPTYTKQAETAREKLSEWNQKNVKRLEINMDETRRKRVGFDGIVHWIPGLFNDDFNYRLIEEKTAKMITDQMSGQEETIRADESELYAQDVQLIAKNGRLFYLVDAQSGRT